MDLHIYLLIVILRAIFLGRVILKKLQLCKAWESQTSRVLLSRYIVSPLHECVPSFFLTFFISEIKGFLFAVYISKHLMPSKEKLYGLQSSTPNK